MAYAIPIIENLSRRTPKLQRADGCQAVVIVPTREVLHLTCITVILFRKICGQILALFHMAKSMLNISNSG